MREDPDIVKMLREEERLGLLTGQSQVSFEESATSGEVLEDMPGKNVGIMTDAKNGLEGSQTNYDKIDIFIEKYDEDFKIIFNSVRDGVALFDKTGKIIKVNQRILEVGGYKKEELVGKRFQFLKMFPPKSVAKMVSNFVKLISGKQVQAFEVEVVTKNGEKLNVELDGTPIKKNDKIVGMVGVIRNITDRKKAEDAMKASEEKYRTLFESASDAIVTLDSKGVVTSCNNAALKMVGLQREEYIDKHFTKLGIFRKRDIPKFIKIYMDVVRGKKIPPFEFQFIRKDGTIGWAEATYTLQKRGRKVIGIQTIIRNVTERKKTEEERKKAQRKIELQNIRLNRLDRIKTEFLNTTSHELRTPMAAVKGYIQMLLKQTLGEITPEQREALNVVLRNTDRLDNIIQEILNISRLESGTMKFIPEKTGITKMIKEVVETMRSSADLKNIKINTELEEVPELIIDPERIKQVLMNLVDNSIKFSPQHSTINLSAKMKKNDVLFEVQDFGRGIPKNKQNKIFDMFYQVDSGMDRKFGGVGLGLTISKGIIKTHGGKIWVDNTYGNGSTFKFTLPIQPITEAKKRFKKEADVFELEK